MTMTLEELESEVFRLKDLESEVAYLRDYIAIWKLNSEYSHLIHMSKMEEIMDLFARETPGIWIELGDTGVYEGLEGLKTVWVDIMAQAAMEPGAMEMHFHVNPVLEISPDGTRARGIWQSPGATAIPIDGKLTAMWETGTYHIDYVKEDGAWKFLKFIWRSIFCCPADKGWVEAHRDGSMGFQAEYPPDRPPSVHLPYNPERVNRFEYNGGLPEPYEE